MFSSFAVDSSGRVFVADNGNNRIQVFGSDGNFIMTIGSLGTSGGQFTNLYGIATTADGSSVFTTEHTAHDRVQKFVVQ